MTSTSERRRAEKTALWSRLFEAFDGRCAYCRYPVRLDAPHGSADFATKDHVIPHSRGGRMHNNVVLSCAACNLMKADKDFRPLLPPLPMRAAP